MTDEKIVKLDVPFKKSDGPIFQDISYSRECRHDGSYQIAADEKDVICAQCNERLNPMSILVKLMNKETNWHLKQERYNDEMKRLSKRQRTKCDNCGQMTRISRR